MKKRYAILLSILLVSLPVLSACDLFGGGDREREYYQQQLEAYKKVQDANQKATEEYNKNLREGLQKWSQEYKEWQDKQLEQQVQKAAEAQAAQ